MANTTNSERFSLKEKKRERGLLYVTLLLLFLSLVVAIIYAVLHQQIDQEREVKQYAELVNMQTKIITELSSVGADLIYYSHSDLAIATLSSPEKTALDYLTSLMYKISSLQKRYDQIRLFDIQGNEIIRIDQNSDFSLQQVPQTKLQNKSERYYFKNALTLQPGQIYTSQFDLNKERGKVEYPIKPMIRFATPIHSKKGELLGAGIINYSGNKILQIITELNVHKGDQVSLVNSDGYYLKGDDAKKEWGFMFPEGEQFLFSDEHPELWKKMQGNKSGKVITADGEYYFSSFNLSPSPSFAIVNSERVFLVMHVPETIINDELLLLIKGLTLGFLFIAPVFLILGWILANSQVEQAWLVQKLSFEARHDALTGLYNRKAIVDYLNKNIGISRRRNSSLSVGFIDVNDLKMMNDRYGHDAGDELIKGVAAVINISIRESDFAARIGGDEFLIVFIDCDEDSANIIMQRIQSIYCSLGLIKTGKKWSMSFGCTELLSKEDTVETMIERADSAMYKQKTYLKKLKGSEAAS